MLSGIGVGGVLGGVAGALAGLGTPEYEAKRYEGRIRKGGILLSVHCDDREWVKIRPRDSGADWRRRSFGDHGIESRFCHQRSAEIASSIATKA